MRQITLDIETVADEAAMTAGSYEPAEGEFPPWPLLQLACVSLLVVDTAGMTGRAFRVATYSRAELSERAIVLEVERELSEADQVLTYNGRGFDAPVLLARAAVCGVEAPNIARLHTRASAGFHLDLLDVVSSHGAAPRPKLAHLCAALDIPAKLEAAGGGVAALAAVGDWRRIGRYCESDVVATWLLNEMWASVQLGDTGRERWTMLADWIRSDQPRLAHLTPYLTLPPEDGGGHPLGPEPLRIVL